MTSPPATRTAATTRGRASAGGRGLPWRHAALTLVACLASALAMHHDEVALVVAVAAVSAGLALGMARVSDRPSPSVPTAEDTPLEAWPLVRRLVPVWMRALETARSHSERATTELLHGLAQVTQRVDTALANAAGARSPHDASALPGETARELQDDLERVLVAAQHQDRLSQMITSVTQDMQRYAEWIGGADDPAARSAQAWLDRLEASYTTDDLRSSHHDTVHVERPSTVEFF